MDELSEELERDEWFLHKTEAEVFERCVAELAIDLSARSTLPALPTLRMTRSV
jgi:hypothetical protein